MHTIAFLEDLAMVMIVAGLVTVIFHRFKQPVVLGYILAGVIIGPHTPPFPLIHEEETVRTLSELGMILLMFSLGLEFSLRKLKQVGAAAFIAAFLEILLMAGVGYATGRMFGWSKMDSIFLGAILSISSTTIIIKALGELGKAKESFAQLIFGILIIEDILAIAMIALLSGIATTGSLNVGDVTLTLGKLALFLVVSLVVGLLAVPRLIGYVARFKSNEMLLVTVLGLCFGFSLLAVKMGYSVALGAFLIGAVIAEAREVHRIETLIEPVRDMFSAIFFVSIGLLIDPKMLVDYWPAILVITAAVVFGKVVSCSLGAFVGGNDTHTSLRVGMGLAQIGEFSFIIAALGLSLNVTSKFLYPIAVAVSALTTLLTPYLIKSADGVVGGFNRVAPRPVMNLLEQYTQWFNQLGSRRHANLASKLMRRWISQMTLNAMLIAAVFVAAAFLMENPPAVVKNLGLEPDTAKTILWLAAVTLALPMFIATARKLQALGLLLAETKLPPVAYGRRASAMHTFFAHVIPIMGTVMLAAFVLILSAALMPPLKVLILLIIVVGLLAWLLRRSFIRVYSKAQIALKETLEQPPAHRPEHPAPALPAILREANLRSAVIESDSPAARKLIRELALRTQTGASIVGIERNGQSLINPGPDEELQAGDTILLLGSRQQLEQAQKLLVDAPA